MAISNSVDRFNGVVASLAIKVRCVVGLTVNVTTPLTGISNPYQGVFLVDGDRVLLTAQTDPILNGIWCVNATGDWSRAPDWDGSRDVELGSTVWAGRSGIQSDVLWQVTAPAGVIQPGNTAVTITQLLDPDAAGGITGSLVDSTVRFDGVDFIENVNLIVEADGRVTHPNAVPTRWLDSAAAPVELLDYELLTITPVGGASAVANFEGTDGARTYTGDDGRVWTFRGSTASNEITNAQAQFGSTSYRFGGQGAQDDSITTVITAEYNAGNFVMGTKDWFIRQWIWNDTSQVGGHDYGCIGDETGTRRAFRWSNNNNTVSLAYDPSGGGGETRFPTFGSAPTDSAWHEFLWERAGDFIYFYLDGVAQGTPFNCAGDTIGGGLVAATKLLVLGSSIQNAVTGITPSPDSFLDSFEMVIGRSANGGVAPGSPSTAPPVADRETMSLGDPASAVRIDANNLNINGAYDLPVADGVAGQSLVTDGAGGVRFGAPASTVPDGSVEGNVLAWDGVSAYRIATGVFMEATGIPPGSQEGYLRFNTTSSTNVLTPQMLWDASNTTSVHYFARTSAVPDGFYCRTASASQTHAWGVDIGGSVDDIFRINEDLQFQILPAASFYISQKGAAGANVASFGQLFVDSADDSLHYITEAGVDFDLTAGGGAVTQIEDGAANVAVIAEGAGIIGVRSAGNTDAEDRRLTWEYQNGTIRSSIGQEFFTDVIYRNHIAGRHQIFYCGTGGSSRLRLHLDGTSATGGVSLYAGTSATPRLATANEGVRIQNGTLFLAEQAAQEANDAGFGQLFVDSADDSLHYITEAGVDTDLTAGGATTFAALTDTDVAGVADHDMLFWDTAAGDWKDTAGLLTADVDGSTIGLTINNITSAKDGALVINDGTNILQSLRLATDTTLGASTITTPLIGGLDIWMSPRNGTRDIILKAREVWIAGAIPSTDHVAFSDDDVDFNTVGSSKVDWNISGFSGAIRIVGPNLGLADTDQLMFGTSDDVTMAYDGVSALDLNLITDDVFNIQEAGVDRFGFNHLNNRLELLTGNRLLAYSSDNLEWMEYYHDGSDGHIGTGGTNPGSILFESATVHVVPTDTVSANAVTLATEDSNGFEVDLEPATAAVVITLGGSPPTGYYAASIKVQQDGATAQTISFAGGTIRHANGVQHPMNTTLDGISIYTIETWDGGTIWYISGVDYS